jgi:serine/threonine protein kinase
MLTHTATTTLTVGTIIGGRYEILGVLGKGGMGMVFKARDRSLDETVALKILRPDVAGSGEMARRFITEIKLARRVRHRNVCGIHEYGDEGGLQYISMEYIEGIDLKHLLREKGALAPHEAFDISIQLARGLEAIHEVGIIHRDLKTANAMLDNKGIVRLMDFGIAKKYGTEASLGATAVGHIIGTPEYMSPEQARGEKIDFRSDIYALGIVVFELFTGRVPFQAETPIATIFKQLQDPPPLDGPLAVHLPTAVLPVIARALAKDPEARYSTAGELGDALRAARASTFPDASTGHVTASAPGATSIIDPRTGAGSLPTMRAPTPPPPTAHTGVSGDAAPTVVTPTPMRAVRTPPSRPQFTPPPLPSPRPVSRRGALMWLILAAVVVVILATVGIIIGISLLPDHTRQVSTQTTPTVTPAPPSPTPTPQTGSYGTTTSSHRPTNPSPTPFRASQAPFPSTPVPTPPPAVFVTPQPTPRATPAPRIETGVVRIIVHPWAQVQVDGKVIGETPQLTEVRLSLGEHRFQFINPEYKPLNRKITVTAGDNDPIRIDLAVDAIPR